MFEKLFGKRSRITREPDKIWKNEARKLDGLLAVLMTDGPAAARSIVIAHFPLTFRSVETFFQTKGIAFDTFFTPTDGGGLLNRSVYQSAQRVVLALSDVLPISSQQRAQDAPEWDFEINLLVTEHHPHPDLDDRVPRFAENLPCPVRICFHDSLDSALIRHFGGTNIERIMTALNMPEGEAISHSMVEKSIRAAQEKIKKQAKRNLYAESAELWLRQNLEQGL